MKQVFVFGYTTYLTTPTSSPKLAHTEIIRRGNLSIDESILNYLGYEPSPDGIAELCHQLNLWTFKPGYGEMVLFHELS